MATPLGLRSPLDSFASLAQALPQPGARMCVVGDRTRSSSAPEIPPLDISQHSCKMDQAEKATWDHINQITGFLQNPALSNDSRIYMLMTRGIHWGVLKKLPQAAKDCMDAYLFERDPGKKKKILEHLVGLYETSSGRKHGCFQNESGEICIIPI
jgi:hypothetical protein